MKKTLSIIIIALISVGLVAPKLVGNNFSKNLDTIAEKVNHTQGYTLEIKTINTKWFSTEALVMLSIDTTNLTGLSDTDIVDNYSVEIKVNAQHGPFLFNEQSNLAWLSWTANIDGEVLREQLDWEENKDFYQSSGLISLVGNYSYHDQITAFTANMTEDNVAVAFSGYQGHGQYTGNKLSYQAGAKDFTATSDEGDFLMNNLTIDMQITASLEEIFNGGLYDSTTLVNFSAINFNDNISESITLTDLYISASSFLDKAKQQGSIQVSYGVKAADISGYQVKDLALETAVNNISGEFVKAYQDFTQTLDDTSAEKMQEKLLDFIRGNLLTLLSSEPQINITSLRGTFPEGKINSSMHSSLVSVSSLPTPIEDQQFWLGHALVTGNISGDKAVIEFFAKEFMKTQLQANPQTQDMSEEEIEKIAIEQVPQMLNMLIKQGLLVATDTFYSTDFALKDSQFKVNEKLIPLPF